MPKAIYKYPLEIKDNQEVLLPEGAQVLTVQMQNNNLCIWAMVDTEEQKETPLKVQIVGTGNRIPFWDRRPTQNSADLTWLYSYLGTVQVGAIAWHVFYQH